MPGDDTKHIDWKAYARTDRYYIKQFEEETNLNCYLLLDASVSMLHPIDEAQVDDPTIEGGWNRTKAHKVTILKFPHRLPCLFYGETAGCCWVCVF